MTARDIMTPGPQTCRVDTRVPEVAQMMCSADCGAIPVVDAQDKPLGIVTDRDIACRLVAKDKEVLSARVRDCMTGEPVTVSVDASDEEVYRMLEDKQIRRLIVVDDQGACCGIISQADVARTAPKGKTGEVVREVSRDKRDLRGRSAAVAP